MSSINASFRKLIARSAIASSEMPATSSSTEKAPFLAKLKFNKRRNLVDLSALDKLKSKFSLKRSASVATAESPRIGTSVEDPLIESTPAPRVFAVYQSGHCFKIVSTNEVLFANPFGDFFEPTSYHVYHTEEPVSEPAKLYENPFGSPFGLLTFKPHLSLRAATLLPRAVHKADKAWKKVARALNKNSPATHSVDMSSELNPMPVVFKVYQGGICYKVLATNEVLFANPFGEQFEPLDYHYQEESVSESEPVTQLYKNPFGSPFSGLSFKPHVSLRAATIIPRAVHKMDKLCSKAVKKVVRAFKIKKTSSITSSVDNVSVSAVDLLDGLYSNPYGEPFAPVDYEIDMGVVSSVIPNPFGDMFSPLNFIVDVSEYDI